ncbi:cytochrome P450 [Sphingobium sp. Z007]|uniref:cytochrome P450 n=1 Tax=Sphingobium sp. Z007 TaxID=627495 RepID=UPI001C532537|nr:cytochrome P450 [Sphingobium sp. Z007]
MPHDYFRFLREEAPISFSPRASDGGFWNVVRHADIQAVERNVEVFSSRANVSPMDVAEAHLANTIDNSIIMTDPPKHNFLRSAIRDSFLPKSVKQLEDSMKVYARNAIDAIIEEGRCDLHDVAAYTPIEVVADVLGVPKRDRSNLFNWANLMFGQLDPELSDDARARLAGFQMISYARRMTKRRRAEPTDDVFSLIANATRDGRQLTDMEMGATFIVLATAGNETTRTQYLHGMAELIARPEVAEELRTNPSLLPNAVDEMLRWTTPALGFARKATQDFELHGQTIAAGQRVMLWYVSGNRDAEVFDDPNTFDIRREKVGNKHLAFGSTGGIHRCLGQMLAKAELNAMFEETLARIPDMRLDGEIRRLRSNFTNGIKHMPVRFTPGRRMGDDTPVPLYATGIDQAGIAAAAAAAAAAVAPTVIEDRDDGIRLVPLARATLTLGVPAVMPGTPRGMRMIVDVADARWEGRINARQLGQPSGDWAVVDSQGTLCLDVRSTLETDDGALIFVRYEGRSDYTKAGASPIIAAPLFETNDPRYAWLNKVQAIAKGRAAGLTTLVYDIYEVR